MLSVLIPYRAPRGSWRHQLADYTARLWSTNASVMPDVEVIHASDKPERRSAPFNFARAANRARAQATGDRLLLVGADAIPPTGDEMWRIRAVLETHPWAMVYAGRHTFTEATTRAILAGEVDPYDVEPDGRYVDACHGVLALRAEAWDAVGGMDERYEGWGYEDIALERALLAAFGMPAAVTEGVQRELWHPPAGRRHAARNRRLFERTAPRREVSSNTHQPDREFSSTPSAPVGPRIVATYAVRDEPRSLVDDLRANLAWCDGVIEVPADRTGGWGHEGKLRARQREAVRERFGEGVWVLVIDPDERLEDGAGEAIRQAVSKAGDDVAFGLQLREMWTPTAYRVDGGWADKKPRWRLFRLAAERRQRFPSKPIHCGVIPVGATRVELDVRLYHLKMVEPANREARRRAYLDADPAGKHQPAAGDWSHLTDETELRLETLPDGRGFTPPYVAGSYLFTAPGRA